jgi:hypothetical protein
MNEAKAKSFEKKTLTESWNREIRMKNIWKAIENHTQGGGEPGCKDCSSNY